MKHFLSTLAISLVFINSSAQSPAVLLDSAKAQMKRNYNLTAIETLGSIQDLRLTAPTLIELLTQHHSGYMQGYTKWVIGDYGGGKKIRQLELDLAPAEILDALVNNNRDDCATSELLASFYSWIFTQEGPALSVADARSVRDYLVKTIPSRCAGSYFYHVKGSADEILEASPSAIAGLKKAVELNSQFAAGWLDLGLASLARKQYADAKTHARKVMELNAGSMLTARAAVLYGKACDETNENDKALASFIFADSLSRKNFHVQKAIMSLYVKTGNPKASQATTSFIGAQGRNSVYCYMDVIEVYEKYGRQADLVMWCQTMLETYQSNPDAVACLHFALGRAYSTVNKETSKEHYRKAKEMGIKPESYPDTRMHPNTMKTIRSAFSTI